MTDQLRPKWTARPAPGGPRPRDELGRPLPREAANRLELEDYDSRTAEENHELGIRAFNDRRFFPAHEAWETAWKQSKGTPDEEFFKGLSQLGAGYVHHQRGNPHGAHTLLRRGAGRIGAYGSSHRGIDVASLRASAEEHADRIHAAEGRGEPAPEIEFPTIRETRRERAMSEPESKKCPVCGRGDLVDVTFRAGSSAAESEAIQESDTRQVESYSCGHEIAGPPLDASAAGTDRLEVERRTSEETAETAES